jgi:DNA-binding NtrC family response regulator
MSEYRGGNVLIVDDEPNALKVLSAILTETGYDVLEASDADSALRSVGKKDVDVVITDVRMPGKDGTQLFDYLSKNYPDIPVIYLTAYGSVDTAVQAITQGAFYFFIKPPDYQKLKSIVSRAVEQSHLKKEVRRLRKQLDTGNRYRITGNSPAMARMMETVESIKNSASSILICGDTGTGKEMIARTIHYTSTRSNLPFVALNCAAIPKELMEAELFGYERGAFTGAVASRVGKFEEAAEGTMFLDEIGEMDLALQAKLLRVLEEREIAKLGSNKHLKVKFKLISSTNRDLKNDVKIGNFREDLYYRINVVQLNVPSLAERREDIPLLVTEFVKEFCAREKKVLTVSDEVMTVLAGYHWPGNIRQLRNVIERAVILSKGDTIIFKDLSEEFLTHNNNTRVVRPITSLKEMEIKAIKSALAACEGNKSKASRMLGISRKALYKRLGESGF